MKFPKRKIKIGIVGCGAIGSRIAKSIKKDLKHDCVLSGIYDIDARKVSFLAKILGNKNLSQPTLKKLVQNCDCVIEAVNAVETRPIIREAIKAGKNVLAMSVGKLLKSQDLFNLARKNNCSILIPSGAIAGIDAIKAAGLVNIQRIILTTRKPPSGFINNIYLSNQGIDLYKMKDETLLFEGDVDTAVKHFPQNINVAATIALASKAKDKMIIKIYSSPTYIVNSHEIEVYGDFGRIVTRTDNAVCPDNPKTSYLAVLSGIQTLKQYCEGILIGT